jgi:hypothetical protein
VVGAGVGAVYAVACTIAHAYTIGWFPVGLLLAIVGLAALLAAVRLLTSDRWAALAAGGGAAVATLVFSGAGPGGSVVVPSGPLGIIWTIAVPILVVTTLAWPEPALPRGRGRFDGELDLPS